MSSALQTVSQSRSASEQASEYARHLPFPKVFLVTMTSHSGMTEARKAMSTSSATSYVLSVEWSSTRMTWDGNTV